MRRVLEQHSELHVIGEASNGLESVHYARTLQPDVIIMDISMPYMDGVQATRLIKEEHPTIIIIGLSVFESSMTRDALMKAGASGLLRKDHAAEKLYPAIQQHVNDL